MDAVTQAKLLADTIQPARGWAANGHVLEQIVVALVAPFVPLYQALPPVAKPALMGAAQAAVFAWFAQEDDRRGWDWARMTEPQEDAFYQAMCQAKVQQILTGPHNISGAKGQNKITLGQQGQQRLRQFFHCGDKMGVTLTMPFDLHQ